MSQDFSQILISYVPIMSHYSKEDLVIYGMKI